MKATSETTCRTDVRLICVAIMANTLILGACTSESDVWQRAQEADTANAYCSFEDRFPDSEVLGDAQQARDDALTRALHDSVRHISSEDYDMGAQALNSADQCNNALVLNNLAVLSVVDQDFDRARTLLNEASQLSDDTIEIGNTVALLILSGEGGEGVVTLAAFATPGMDTTGLAVAPYDSRITFFPVGSVLASSFELWTQMSNHRSEPEQTPSSAIAANVQALSD